MLIFSITVHQRQGGVVPKLGGANGGKICGVGKENCPRVTDPVVELDISLGGLRGEVGSNGAETEGRHFVVVFLGVPRRSELDSLSVPLHGELDL